MGEGAMTGPRVTADRPTHCTCCGDAGVWGARVASRSAAIVTCAPPLTLGDDLPPNCLCRRRCVFTSGSRGGGRGSVVHVIYLSQRSGRKRLVSTGGIPMQPLVGSPPAYTHQYARAHPAQPAGERPDGHLSCISSCVCKAESVANLPRNTVDVVAAPGLHAPRMLMHMCLQISRIGKAGDGVGGVGEPVGVTAREAPGAVAKQQHGGNNRPRCTAGVGAARMHSSHSAVVMTATSPAPTASRTASAICLVRRSCTCRRLAMASVARASFDRPTTRSPGM